MKTYSEAKCVKSEIILMKESIISGALICGNFKIYKILE